MKWFSGTVEELKALVNEVGSRGDWSETEHGYQFRSKNGAILNWFPSTGTIQYQGPKTAREGLEQALAKLPAPDASKTVRAAVAKDELPRVFVVHGHDDTAREQLELILHRLDLNPFVLANTGGAGMTIIEALEREIVERNTRCRFGIVLLTPDDMGYSVREGDIGRKPRARQNVVLEMGMLLATLGRSNVVILQKGFIELPSDAQGIIYIPFNNHVRETVPKLADRLRVAGFEISAQALSRASS